MNYYEHRLFEIKRELDLFYGFEDRNKDYVESLKRERDDILSMINKMG